MDQKLGADTLLIIPCCAAKAPKGPVVGSYTDPLKDVVSQSAYAELLLARANVLREVKRNPRFITDKYAKNAAILPEGEEFGGPFNPNRAATYLPAISRYTGTLYSVPGLKAAIVQAVTDNCQPRIMILSALYGPLHPMSQIQDYNLKMSDAPARVWSRSFPPFLEDYVANNGITSLYLYVGSATAYFSIAREAAVRLLRKGLLRRAVQYHIEEGDTRTTPLQHGARLLSDLSGIANTGILAPDLVKTNALCL